MATDYKKWDRVDYKSLGASSSSSDVSDDDAAHRGRGSSSDRKEPETVTPEEYIRRTEEVEKAKARLKELEKEQDVLQKKLQASEAASKRTERWMQVGFFVMAMLLMAVQYYLGGGWDAPAPIDG